MMSVTNSFLFRPITTRITATNNQRMYAGAFKIMLSVRDMLFQQFTYLRYIYRTRATIASGLCDATLGNSSAANHFASHSKIYN